MANGLFNIIANPQIANVAGAVQLGQQQSQQNQLFQQQQQQFQQQQEQLSNQQRVQKLAGEVLGQTLGGKLAGDGFDELVRLDPKTAIAIAEGLGVPLNQPGRIKNLFGTAQMAETIGKSVGPTEALQFIQTEREKLASFGIQTPLMDQFIQDFQQNPSEALISLGEFVESGKQAGILKGGTGLVSDKELAETEKLKAETDKILADIQKKSDKPGPINFKDFRALNNDVTSLIKEPLQVRKAADRLSAIGKTKSATDQLAAIFTFMKALDPTSVVREGEQRQAASTGGVTDQFIGFVNKIIGEGALPPAVFESMILTAKTLANEATEGATSTLSNSLNAFGDRLTEDDRSKLLKRIPESFDIGGIAGGELPGVLEAPGPLSPEAAQPPTARDAQGNTVQFINGQWVPVGG